MKWLIPFAPDEFAGPLALLAIVMVGMLLIFGMRAAARSWALIAGLLVFLPVLFDTLLMPVIEEHFERMPVALVVLICAGLALMMLFGVIAALFGPGVRDHVVGDLLAHAIRGVLRGVFFTLFVLPFRLVSALLRLVFQ